MQGTRGGRVHAMLAKDWSMVLQQGRVCCEEEIHLLLHTNLVIVPLVFRAELIMDRRIVF